VGQLIFVFVLIVIAVGISLKQQLDKAAKEDQRRKGEPHEGLPEHVQRAMRLMQGPLPVEPEAEPEVMVVRQEAQRPEVVVRRVCPQEPRRAKPPKAEARPPKPRQRVAARRLPGTLKSTDGGWGKRETTRQVSLPQYRSPIVTAIVMHEILMPPVSLKRTQQIDMLERIV